MSSLILQDKVAVKWKQLPLDCEIILISTPDKWRRLVLGADWWYRWYSDGHIFTDDGDNSAGNSGGVVVMMVITEHVVMLMMMVDVWLYDKIMIYITVLV